MIDMALGTLVQAVSAQGEFQALGNAEAVSYRGQVI